MHRPTRPSSAMEHGHRPVTMGKSSALTAGKRAATPKEVDAAPAGYGKRPVHTQAAWMDGGALEKQGSLEAASDDNASLFQQQLRDVLQRQAVIEDKHQREVVRYRHALRRCYNDNSVLRNIIRAALSRQLRQGGAPVGTAASVTEAEEAYLSHRANLATRKMNRLQHEVRRAERILRQVQQVHSEAETELGAPLSSEVTSGANRSVFVRIQILEKRLNEVLSNKLTVSAVLKGYQYHLDQLLSESNLYDTQIHSIDADITAKHRDLFQLVTLYTNAVDDYRIATEQSSNFTRQFDKLRRAKESALVSKRAAVQQALVCTQRQERHIAKAEQQLEAETQLLEDVEKERDEQLQHRRVGRGAMALLQGEGETLFEDTARDLVTDHTAEEEEKYSAYDTAFSEMMRRARVTNLDALVETYKEAAIRQRDMQSQVQEKRAAYRAELDAVAALRKKVEERKTCGPGLPMTTRALQKEVNAFLSEEVSDRTQAVMESAHNKKRLQDLLDAVNRLSDKMAAYRPDIYIPPVAHTATLPRQLAVLTQKILSLVDDSTRPVLSSQRGGLKALQIVTTAQVLIPENNVRINLNGKRTSKKAKQLAAATAVGLPSSLRSKHRASPFDVVAQGHGESDDRFIDGMEGTERLSYDDSSSTVSDAHHPGTGVRNGALTPFGGNKEHYKSGGTCNELSSITSNDPLVRADVKRMSAAVEAREQKRLEKELRRRKTTSS